MSAYLVVLAFVTGFGLPVAVIFASMAQGKATVAALEGITRQPESAPRAQLSLIIGLALIEALVIYSLLMFFLLVGKLPSVEVDDMLKMGEIMSKQPAVIETPAKMVVAPANMIATTDKDSPSTGDTSTTAIKKAVTAPTGEPMGEPVSAMTSSDGKITAPDANKDNTYVVTHPASQ